MLSKQMQSKKSAHISKIWIILNLKTYKINGYFMSRASQHGTDLVAPLSNILNSSIDNDLASSLALDAIVWLCKSHTVNIVSTWKVLRGVFESKLQFRTTKRYVPSILVVVDFIHFKLYSVLISMHNSLCEFFGEVPLLKSTSDEYDLLFREALDRLWHFISNSSDIGIIKTALRALRNFDLTELTLKHIPSAFYENIKLPKEYQIQIVASQNDPNTVPLTVADVVPYVPGECWIDFLQQVNPDVLEDAIDLVTYLIENEMSQYRSGVYMLAEGRPEPKELQHLHARSPLRSIVKFLAGQSEDKSDFANAIRCLRCIEKKFSRPIPPLNWFFLIEYINQGTTFGGATATDQLNMKKYALTIAGNQIAHSGSAKSLVENYLQSFDVRAKDLDEIQMALELVASVCDGVSPRILVTFIRDTLTFLHGLSASSHFEDNCHFEVGIKTISRVFDKKCLVLENVDIVTDEICRFNENLQSDSKVCHPI